MQSLVGSGNKPALDFREAVELCQHLCSTDEEHNHKFTPLPGFVPPTFCVFDIKGRKVPCFV